MIMVWHQAVSNHTQMELITIIFHSPQDKVVIINFYKDGDTMCPAIVEMIVLVGLEFGSSWTHDFYISQDQVCRALGRSQVRRTFKVQCTFVSSSLYGFISYTPFKP
jgi:hypothetical protein